MGTVSHIQKFNQPRSSIKRCLGRLSEFCSRNSQCGLSCLYSTVSFQVTCRYASSDFSRVRMSCRCGAPAASGGGKIALWDSPWNIDTTSFRELLALSILDL